MSTRLAGAGEERRVMAGSGFYAGKHPLLKKRIFLSIAYRIKSRLSECNYGLSLVSVLRKC